MKKTYRNALLKQYISHPAITSKFSENLLQYFELFSFKKGDFIIKQGYCSEYLYFVGDGKVRVFLYTPSGNITLLSFCSEFEPLGDSASLWNREAVANVEALTDGYCIGISLTKYRDTLLQDPIFLRQTCETLANKLNESNTIISNVFLGSIENRLAYYILHTSRNSVFTTNLSECAVIMRTSYRHLLRVLNTFCQNNLLEKKGKDYIVINSEELKTIAFETEQ